MIEPYIDDHYQVHLLVDTRLGSVFTIPIQPGKVLVKRMAQSEFKLHHRPTTDYPLESIVKHLLGLSEIVGATPEALGYLKAVVKVSEAQEKLILSRGVK